LSQGWQTEEQSAVLLLSAIIGLDQILFIFYLLTLTEADFKSASVAGLTVIKYQPRMLVRIVKDDRAIKKLTK